MGPNPKESFSILVAEDDRFLANAYRVKLTKAGFTVQNAYDGEEALHILETFTPNIILLDLVMPKKDGFATLSEIKANEKWKNYPIIISSNLGQKEDIDRALKLGASDYIVKADTSLEDIVSKIRSLVTHS